MISIRKFRTLNAIYISYTYTHTFRRWRYFFFIILKRGVVNVYICIEFLPDFKEKETTKIPKTTTTIVATAL